MNHIKVSTLIDAPPPRVWADVRQIASHVEWMDDAVAIRFTSERRGGVGTTFDCDTRVGPFRLTDRMEVTEWEDGRAIGICHIGMVTGAGRFTLSPARRDRTRFTWEERLRFPWWMGGSLGGMVGSRVLKAVWRRNLAHLRRRFEP
jgi:Polyketide cyclase / dehydrase and lipid transport